MMLKPTNQEPDLAERRPIGKRTQSAAVARKGKTSRPVSKMATASQSGNKAKQQYTTSSTGAPYAASQMMDLNRYRGNLYKQTLAPGWSKQRRRQAQEKFT